MLIASRPLVTTPTRFCLILAIMLYLTYLALNDDAVQHFSSSRDPFRHFLTLLLCYGPQWDQNRGSEIRAAQSGPCNETRNGPQLGDAKIAKSGTQFWVSNIWATKLGLKNWGLKIKAARWGYKNVFDLSFQDSWYMPVEIWVRNLDLHVQSVL